MEIPILGFPGYINELGSEFEHLFPQKRQTRQFKRLIAGFAVADKHSIAHMNGMFVHHTDQSNLNRFITKSGWKPDDVNKIKIEMINSVEGGGVVVIDDYLVEKYGKEMYGVDWYYDHAKNGTVWGVQVADCVFSGKGIYPLLSTQYVRENSRWDKGGFMTKIEIQMRHLTRLVDAGLIFSCVAMDIWYFSKDLIRHIEGLNKDWTGQCKGNRLVWSRGAWTPLAEFANREINRKEFRAVKIAGDTYLMKAFTVKMKEIGTVRILVSLNKHGNFTFYASNRLDWGELDIVKHYSPRWDIEVWHREGKNGYGLKDCTLRGRDAVSKYLTLSALAQVFLEIASMLSPVYAMLKKQVKTPELKRRWVIIEMVKQLIALAHRNKDKIMGEVFASILCPYGSTMGKINKAMPC